MLGVIGPAGNCLSAAEVEIGVARMMPYDDPLIIPWGLKASQKSWGDCEKATW